MIIDTTDGDTILEASDRLSVLAHTIFLVHLQLLLFCLQRRLYKSDVFSIWPVHNDNRFFVNYMYYSYHSYTIMYTTACTLHNSKKSRLRSVMID